MTWQEAWLNSGDDPYLFVTGVLGYAPYGTPEAPGVFVLEQWQEQTLKAIRDGANRVSIRSGHGVGKTAFLSWLALWGVFCHKDCKVPIAANTENQLRDVIWPELRKQARNLPGPLQSQIDIQAERAFIRAAPDLAFIVRRTASKDNPEALAGFHADFLLFLVDEASGITDPIFETAIGALSTAGAIFVMTSNPTRGQGYFYDSHHRLREKWFTLRVNSEDVPRARGHIQDVIDTYGRNSNKYRVRVQGEFPTTDDAAAIPLELIVGAVGRDVEQLDVRPMWGLDVARFGDDTSALAKRKGNKLIETTIQWRNLDTMQIVGRVADIYAKTPEEEQPFSINVDEIGIGAGVVDRLRELGLPAYGVNVSESSAVSEKYRRLRDELWWLGREWFQARNTSMVRDEGLIAELSGPTYDFTSSGQIVIESKRDLKARNVPSPNRADAFLMTFARPDVKILRRRRYQTYDEGSAWSA